MYYCEKHRNHYKEYMSQDRYKDANRLRMRKTRLTKRAADGGVCVCANFDFIPTENGKCIACGLPRRR